jgi:hypothetical protein
MCLNYQNETNFKDAFELRQQRSRRHSRCKKHFLGCLELSLATSHKFFVTILDKLREWINGSLQDILHPELKLERVNLMILHQNSSQLRACIQTGMEKGSFLTGSKINDLNKVSSYVGIN